MATTPPFIETQIDTEKPEQVTQQMRDVLKNPYSLVDKDTLWRAIREDFPALKKYMQEEQASELDLIVQGAPMSSEDQILTASEILLKKYLAKKEAQKKSTARQSMEDALEEDSLGSGFRHR